MWLMRGHASDRPKLNLYLSYHLHPSTLPVAEYLEYVVFIAIFIFLFLYITNIFQVLHFALRLCYRNVINQEWD